MVKRVGVVVALLAMSACTSTEEAAPNPSVVPSPAGAETPVMPPGKTCAEVAAAVGKVTELPLRARGEAVPGAESQPGARECVLEADAPVAEVRVTLYRLRFGVDTSEGLLE